jgi:hypothetical protein
MTPAQVFTFAEATHNLPGIEVRAADDNAIVLVPDTSLDVVGRCVSPDVDFGYDSHHDSELEARLQARLNASSYPAVRRIRCQCADGLVCLFGKVPSYYCIQIAISVLRGDRDNSFPISIHLEVAT